METKNLWIAQYDPVERTFQIDTLEHILKTNVEIILSGRDSPGYVLCGIYASHDEAHAAIHEFRQSIDIRRSKESAG